jgi:hypothetical protein
MMSIASRLKISFWKVRKILTENIVDPEKAFFQYDQHRRFKKLNQRAREIIENTIINANIPLSVPEIQKQV